MTQTLFLPHGGPVFFRFYSALPRNEVRGFVGPRSFKVVVSAVHAAFTLPTPQPAWRDSGYTCAFLFAST